MQKIIPADIPEEDVRAIYQEYSEKFRHIALFFNQQVPGRGGGYPHAADQPGEAAVSRLVIESTLIAGFSKILAEKLIRLCGADTQEVLAAEQPPDVRLLHFTARRIPCPSGRGIFALCSHSLRQGTRALPLQSILSINVP